MADVFVSYSRRDGEFVRRLVAALELAGAPFACDYVGHMPAAKDFGRLRMYRLRRAR